MAALFEDSFDSPAPDPSRWLPAYLPHWSRLDRTRPSLEIRDGHLRLFIRPDQPEWAPGIDPGVRVSALQTGHFSGPPGSAEGQHRFRPGLRVRDAQAPKRLFLMHRGRLQIRARTRLGPRNLAALWLIGYEDQPHRSGEITVMEIFGTGTGATGARLGHGIKKITDPALTQEFRDPPQPIDPARWHDYAIDWTAEGIRFLLDGREIGRTRQSPDYPMQMMLTFYDLPGPGPSLGPEEAWFDIARIRATAPEPETDPETGPNA